MLVDDLNNASLFIIRHTLLDTNAEEAELTVTGIYRNEYPHERRHFRLTVTELTDEEAAAWEAGQDGEAEE